jgi:hypothetical protein
MEFQGKTIYDTRDRKYKRVQLDSAELRELQEAVIDFNAAVFKRCYSVAEVEFDDLEPERRLRVAEFLANKAGLQFFTAELAALDAKVGTIKDAEREERLAKPAPLSAAA